MVNMFEKYNNMIPRARLLAVILALSMIGGDQKQDRVKIEYGPKNSDTGIKEENTIKQVQKDLFLFTGAEIKKPNDNNYVTPHLPEENLPQEYYEPIDSAGQEIVFPEVPSSIHFFNSFDDLLTSDELPYTAYKNDKSQKIAFVLGQNQSQRDILLIYFNEDEKLLVKKIIQDVSGELKEYSVPEKYTDTSEKITVYEINNQKIILKESNTDIGAIKEVIFNDITILTSFRL